jgi:hypothetical protein
MTLSAILFVASLVLCVLAGFNVGSPRFNLGWLGAACFVAGVLAGKVL